MNLLADLDKEMGYTPPAPTGMDLLGDLDKEMGYTPPAAAEPAPSPAAEPTTALADLDAEVGYEPPEVKARVAPRIKTPPDVPPAPEEEDPDETVRKSMKEGSPEAEQSFLRASFDLGKDVLSQMVATVGQIETGVAKAPGALVDTFAGASNLLNKGINKVVGKDVLRTDLKAHPKLYNNAYTRMLEDSTKQYDVLREQYKDDDLVSLIEKKDYSNAAKYLTLAGLGQASQIGMMALASYLGIPPTATLGLMGASTGAEKLDNYRDREAAGEELPPEHAAILNAWVHGGAEVVFERMGSMRIAERFSDAVKAVVKRGGVKAGRKYANSAIKNVFKGFLGGASEEAKEEIATSLTQDISDKALGLQPNLTWKDMVKNAFEAGAIALVSGGPFGGATQVAKEIAARREPAKPTPPAEPAVKPEPTPEPVTPPAEPAIEDRLRKAEKGASGEFVKERSEVVGPFDLEGEKYTIYRDKETGQERMFKDEEILGGEQKIEETPGEQAEPQTETEERALEGEPAAEGETKEWYTKKTQELKKKYASKPRADASIIDPIGADRSRLERITDEEHRKDVEKNIRLQEDAKIPGVVKLQVFEDIVRKLDEKGIKYTLVRMDGVNMKGSNDTHGHTGTDARMKALWGDILQTQIAEYGGILARDQGDELYAVFPEYTVDETNEILEDIREQVRSQLEKHGLHNLEHARLKLTNTPTLDFVYGAVESQPGKYGDMDRAADELVEEKKNEENKLRAEQEGMVWDDVRKIYTQKVVDKTTKEPILEGEGGPDVNKTVPETVQTPEGQQPGPDTGVPVEERSDEGDKGKGKEGAVGKQTEEKPVAPKAPEKTAPKKPVPEKPKVSPAYEQALKKVAKYATFDEWFKDVKHAGDVDTPELRKAFADAKAETERGKKSELPVLERDVVPGRTDKAAMFSLQVPEKLPDFEGQEKIRDEEQRREKERQESFWQEKIRDEEQRREKERQESFWKGPHYAGSINVLRMNSPADVKGTLMYVAGRESKRFHDARQGTRTFQQTRAKAEEVGRILGFDTASLVKTVRQKTDDLDAYITAARDVLNSGARQVTKLLKAAQANNNDENLAKFRLAIRNYMYAISEISGASGKIGRALGAHRIMSQQAKGWKDILESFGGRDVAEEILKQTQKGQFNPDDVKQIADFSKKFADVKVKDMVMEAWINFLLSSPTTHLANIISNTGNMVVVRPLEKYSAAMVSNTISLFSGKPAKTSFKEANATVVQTFKGFVDGARAFLYAAKTEQASELMGKTEQMQKAIPGVTGKVVRTPGRLLMAADEFYKAALYRGSIAGQATKIAKTSRLKGKDLNIKIAEIIENPTNEMIDKARMEARYWTFTDPVGDITKAIQLIRRKAWPFRFILPFLNTPSRIASFTLERFPLTGIPWKMYKGLKESWTEEQWTEEMAKLTIGSGLAAAAGLLAMSGMVTGGGPKEKEKRQALYSAGWLPYAVLINGRYVSYARFEPVASVVGMTADLVELSEPLSEDEYAKAAGMVAMSFAKNVTSKTFMTGLSDLMEAINAPERYGEDWIQKMSGTVIPSGVAAWARASDKYMRKSDTVMETLKGRIPGLAKDLIPRRDIWGRPIERTGHPLYRFIVPVNIGSERTDKLSNELVELGVGVRLPGNKIDTFEITPEMQDYYAAIAGERARRLVQAIINRGSYRNMPSDSKKDAVEKAFLDARTYARNQVKAKYRRWFIQQRAETQREKK